MMGGRQEGSNCAFVAVTQAPRCDHAPADCPAEAQEQGELRGGGGAREVILRRPAPAVSICNRSHQLRGAGLP